MDRSKSTRSDGGEDSEYVARREVHTHIAERNSSASVMDVGCGSMDEHGKNEGKNRDVSGKTSAAGLEKKTCEKNLMGCDNLTRTSKHAANTTTARAETSVPSTVLPHDSGLMKQAHDALLMVGLTAHDEKEYMEASIPFKPISLSTNTDKEKPETKEANTSPVRGKKLKAKVQIKKLAKEKGKGKGPDSEAQFPLVGTKRDEKIIFEDNEEDSITKKRCTKSGIS